MKKVILLFCMFVVLFVCLGCSNHLPADSFGGEVNSVSFSVTTFDRATNSYVKFNIFVDAIYHVYSRGFTENNDVCNRVFQWENENDLKSEVKRTIESSFDNPCGPKEKHCNEFQSYLQKITASLPIKEDYGISEEIEFSIKTKLFAEFAKMNMDLLPRNVTLYPRNVNVSVVYLSKDMFDVCQNPCLTEELPIKKRKLCEKWQKGYSY